MYRKFFPACAAVFTLISMPATADELTGYVNNCMNELNFTAAEVPSNLNCNDGLGFNVTQGTPINDYVGHARINAAVDLVFACRWLSAKKPAYSPTALSIELLIHNRHTGGTCFFAAKDPTNPPENVDPKVSTSIVAPTAWNASSYWMSPTSLEGKRFRVHGASSPNTRLRCVGCHIAGPYVASHFIASSLARFGLLNDDHDTHASRYYAVKSPPMSPEGASAFMQWNAAIQKANNTSTCASACHSIGTGSTAGTILDAAGQVSNDTLSFEVITALQDHIKIVSSLMPPGNPANPAFMDISRDYTWVNMASPFNLSGDFETLWQVQNRYPQLACNNPVSLEAHVVDSDEPIRTNELPDKLDRFNLQDGLVCLNNAQPGGRCQDYQVRYMCNGRFTAFQSNDTPGSSGDWEPRNGFKNLCANPTWIQTRFMSGGVWKYVNGPADRLAQFDSQGLVCYNSDQNNGQCSNYVARFECPH